MEPSDAFGVAVRTIGLALWLYGLWCVLYAASVSFGAASPPPEEKKSDLKDYWSAGITFLMVGGTLFFGAKYFVEMAYR